MGLQENKSLAEKTQEKIAGSVLNPLLSVGKDVTAKGNQIAADWPLSKVVAFIHSDKLKKKTASVRDTLQNDHKSEKEKAKKSLPFACFGGSFYERDNEKLRQASGLVQHDLDKIEDVEHTISYLKTKPEVVVLYRTISGHGIRVVFRSNKPPQDDAEYKTYWEAGKRYLQAWGFPTTVIDSVKDVARASFLCHDPDAYLNQNAISIPPVESLDAPYREKDAQWPICFSPIWLTDCGDSRHARLLQLIGHYSRIKKEVWKQVVEPLLREEWERVTRQENRQHEYDAAIRDLIKEENFGTEQEAKSGAERTYKYEQKQKAAFYAWVEEQPEHLHSLLMKEFHDGEEAGTILTNADIAKGILHIEGKKKARVRDERGLLHELNSDTGNEIFTAKMMANRDALRRDLKVLKEQEIAEAIAVKIKEAEKKVGRISDDRKGKVSDSVQLQAAFADTVEHIKAIQLDQRRAIQFENMVYDVRTRLPLTLEEIKAANLTYQTEQGQASPYIDVEQEIKRAKKSKKEERAAHIKELRQINQDWFLRIGSAVKMEKESRETISFFGDRAFRFYNYYMSSTKKEGGVYYSRLSGSGKSTLARIYQLGTGMVYTMLATILEHAGKYSVLEIKLSEYFHVVIDESDKIKFTASQINNAYNTTKSEANEKTKAMREVKRRGNLSLLTAGPIDLDWTAQGIMPDDDGQGGRINGCFTVEHPDKMPKELGEFWNDDDNPDILALRPKVLSEVMSYALSLPEWDEGEQKRALEELRGFVHLTSPSWKKGLENTLERSDKEIDFVPSAAIDEIIDLHSDEDKRVGNKEKSNFLYRRFGAKSNRAMVDGKQVRVYRNLRRKPEEQEG